MILHLTSTAHDIASCRIVNSVTCASCNIHRFENVNVRTGHLSVTYQETGCCQRCQSASYQICMLVINAFRFFRSGECFVITICIVNAFAVLLVLAPLRIAVLLSCCILSNLNCILLFRFLVFSCCDCCYPCACGNCCHSNTDILFLSHIDIPPFNFSLHLRFMTIS